jgi:hypothetical protein
LDNALLDGMLIADVSLGHSDSSRHRKTGRVKGHQKLDRIDGEPHHSEFIPQLEMSFGGDHSISENSLRMMSNICVLLRRQQRS